MKTTGNEFINAWLHKYHGVTIEECIEEHPEWKETSHEFYTFYQVTQEQHDEWYEWAIATVMKEYKLSKKRAKRDFIMAYLNLAPMVIDIKSGK